MINNSVSVNFNKCIGCRVCYTIDCSIVQWIRDGVTHSNEEKCENCENICVQTCPMNAIDLYKNYVKQEKVR